MSDVRIPETWQLTDQRNPYLHNFFILLNLSPDASQDDIIQACAELERRLEAEQEVEVHGHRLLMSDASRGHKLAADAQALAAERLLVHTHHDFKLAAFAAFFEKLNSIPIPKPAEVLPLPAQNLAFLARMLPEPEEIQPLDAFTLSEEQRRALFQPQPTDEQVYDL